MDSLQHHFVLPGQVLATSNSENEGGFLRGHGTYIELVRDTNDDTRGAVGTKKWGSTSVTNNSDAITQSDDDKSTQSEDGEGLLQKSGPQRLIASLAGSVQRVNKLISVIPSAPSVYSGQVGDLVVGRIVGVGGSRWRVSLTCSPPNSASGSGMKEGQLPLSGVNLPGGVQRIRTSEDVLAMRSLYKEGDLLTCEVQSVQKDGTLILHTRSLRYGKLENGVLITVPPVLVGRRKNHFVTLKGLYESTNADSDAMDMDETDVDVYLGLNGGIWIQRTVPQQWEDSLRSSDQDSRAPLAETLQKLRQQHCNTRVSSGMRESIARVRNGIECLRLVKKMICPESIEDVVMCSLKLGVRVGDMLFPEWVVKLTEGTRSRQRTS
jgi:exosome complex component RRP4